MKQAYRLVEGPLLQQILVQIEAIIPITYIKQEQKCLCFISIAVIHLSKNKNRHQETSPTIQITTKHQFLTIPI